MDLITRTLLFFLITCIAITIQNTQYKEENSRHNEIGDSPKVSKSRPQRGIYIHKRKPGPIRQVFGLVYEQWDDTRKTMNNLSRLINDNFLPENATLTTTTPNPNPNATTAKPPPFKITRSEFYKILRRNLRGLVRLYRLELADAYKQSRVTQREHHKNVSKEISKFL